MGSVASRASSRVALLGQAGVFALVAVLALVLVPAAQAEGHPPVWTGAEALWTPPGGQTRSEDGPSLAMAVDGSTAVAAWTVVDGADGSFSARVLASVQTSGTWSAPQVLETDAVVDRCSPRAVVSADGGAAAVVCGPRARWWRDGAWSDAETIPGARRDTTLAALSADGSQALAVWTEFAGADYPGEYLVRASWRRAGTWETPREVARRRALRDVSLVLSADGSQALIAWVAGVPTGSPAYNAVEVVRGSAQEWAEPDQVSVARDTIGAVRLAASRDTSRAVALWSQDGGFFFSRWDGVSWSRQAPTTASISDPLVVSGDGTRAMSVRMTREGGQGLPASVWLWGGPARSTAPVVPRPGTHRGSGWATVAFSDDGRRAVAVWREYDWWDGLDQPPLVTLGTMTAAVLDGAEWTVPVRISAEHGATSQDAAWRGTGAVAITAAGTGAVAVWSFPAPAASGGEVGTSSWSGLVPATVTRTTGWPAGPIRVRTLRKGRGSVGVRVTLSPAQSRAMLLQRKVCTGAAGRVRCRWSTVRTTRVPGTFRAAVPLLLTTRVRTTSTYRFVLPATPRAQGYTSASLVVRGS